MNKIFPIAAIVALVATLSFAQEGCECPKFGIRAGFNLNDPTGDDAKELDMGFGFGGGVAVNMPITDFLSFNPELGFYYRKLTSMSEKDAVDKDVEYYYYLDEFALSIPAMLRFAPNGVVPFYLAAGVQLDIPFSTKSYSERSYQGDKTISAGKKIYGRAEIDFGIALGLGYNITPNFGIDLRCVIGLTDFYDVPNVPEKDESEVSLNQYGIGVTYFF